MKKILVCKNCGSPRCYYDACVNVNTEEVNTYDSASCGDCGYDSNSLLIEVEVDDDFDLDAGTVKLGVEA